MPYIATSCCTLKASLCRDRSCCLLNSVCPYTRLVGKGCCLCNPVSHGSCNNFKGCSTPFTRFLSISFASPKRNGRKKRAPLRGASRDRTIAHFFEMTAIVCAYLVSDCVGRFEVFLSIIFCLCFAHFGFLQFHSFNNISINSSAQ